MFAVLALGLLFLLPGGPLQAQDSGTIMYAEDRTDAVATYTAADPEMPGDAIKWNLSGTDAGAFMIDGGVLTFAKQPNYEMPADVEGTGTPAAAAGDNMYEVTIRATNETGQTGTKDVMVEVTNVDEDGTVTLSARRPQSATAFTASLRDDDGSVTRISWQWAKSGNRNGPFTDIATAMSATYTPEDADINSYLRATAMYTDPQGSGKMEMETSDFAVQGIRGGNRPPVFRDQDPDTQGLQNTTATRSVAEDIAAGQAVGAPFVADDIDGDDLTYTLTDSGGTTTGDSASFSINWVTGQVMAKEELDAENGTTYTVVVRATDPAGVPQVGTAVPANSATITVTITVTDVNEPPKFDTSGTNSPAEVTVTEAVGDTAAEITGSPSYTATDEDNDDTTVTFKLSGPDMGKFDIGESSGELSLATGFNPSYEKAEDANGDNVYEITVEATAGAVADGRDMTGTMDVKVMIDNQDEAGMVTLDRPQPAVGVEVTADLTDPDGNVSGTTWQWYQGQNITTDSLPTTQCSEGVTDDCFIKDATAMSYMPTAGDATRFLTVVAMYIDGQGTEKVATDESDRAVFLGNLPPMFTDEDPAMAGVQAMRKVAENAGENGDVGTPVMASDPNEGTDALTYELSGADAGTFKVTQDDLTSTNTDEGGQIQLADDVKLDYETEDTYMVTLTARDSLGAASSIDVTIMVTDVNEAPVITGDDTTEYAEDRTDAVATYTAADPEMPGDAIKWNLSGTDAGAFMIDGGVLTFAKQPNYEMPADVEGTGTPAAAAGDNMYEVTIRATNETGQTGTKDVMVEVTNVDEDGTVTLSARRPQSATAFTASLRDDDGSVTRISWQWAKSGNRNGPFTDIATAMSATYTPEDADINSYLRATAMYTDPQGSGKMEMETSDFAVQGIRGGNRPPVFRDQDPDTQGLQNTTATRSVAEDIAAGQAVGAPFVADDIDGDDLTYTLTDSGGTTTGDSASFSINWVTGQVMAKEELDAENGTTYTVVVRATDPAGVPQVGTAVPANSATITVTITVTDVNEPPKFDTSGTNSPAEVTVTEAVGDTAAEITGSPSYTATDEDNDDTTVTFKLSGPDMGKFDIGESSGELSLATGFNPSYEKAEDANGDNVYEITVEATAGAVADGRDMTGTMDVKVMIDNQDEAGMVTLDRPQPAVGVEVTADLTDPDGNVSGTTWQWYQGQNITTDSLPTTQCSEGVTDDCFIKDATAMSYMPTAGDATRFLTVVAMYIDGQGTEKVATDESDRAVFLGNLPPMFTDEDPAMAGVQAMRKVAENAGENGDVGTPVMASDPNEGTDALTYELSGADAGTFKVTQDDLTSTNTDEGGQIQLADDVKLDYETEDTYMVTLTARDSLGAASSIDVTIMVTDVNEAPVIVQVPTENQAPMFRTSSTTRSIPEGQSSGRAIGAVVTAIDPGDRLTYTLEGTDAASFSIDRGTGQLRTSASLDQGSKSSYMVTVRATDSGGLYDTITVTITVTEVDDMVGPDPADPLLAEYDDDKNGWIQLEEARDAVGDYFVEPKGTVLSLEDARKIVGLYFEYKNSLQ